MIERKGARTGLITTEGFRDVIEIGREKRYDGWDLKISFPEPLIERALRLEVAERVHADGCILLPLDRNALREVVAALVREGVESIAVCLLHAYKNSIHEQAVQALIEEIAPEVPVSISSEVLPEINEYERVSTTAVNAYTKPTVARYLARLERRMAGLGARPLHARPLLCRRARGQGPRRLAGPPSKAGGRGATREGERWRRRR